MLLDDLPLITLVISAVALALDFWDDHRRKRQNVRKSLEEWREYESKN